MPTSRTSRTTRGRERLAEIGRLDPVTDYTTVIRGFQKDFESARLWAGWQSLAITYAIPSMSRILIDSALMGDIGKRLVDTEILMHAMYQGFEGGAGRDAVRRMNQMHKMYPIVKDDYVFVSCVEIVHAVRAAEAYGWRDVHENERRALTHHGVVRAGYMGLAWVPETYARAEQFYDTYLDEHAAFEPQNKRLADVLTDAFIGRFPAAQQRLMHRSLLAASDPRILAAIDYPVPSPVERRALRLLWSVVARRRDPGDPDVHLPEAGRRRVYPDGYEIGQVGTFAPGASPSCPHAAGTRSATGRPAGGSR